MKFSQKEIFEILSNAPLILFLSFSDNLLYDAYIAFNEMMTIWR